MPKGKQNKRYTPEFKIKVVETMHKERLSQRRLYSFLCKSHDMKFGFYNE